MTQNEHAQLDGQPPGMGGRATVSPGPSLAASPSAIQRRLQVAMAVLTSLGSLLLGMAQWDLRLGVFATLAAGASVYFTDRKGWLVLNSTAANLAGVVALLLTLWHWQETQRELLLFSLANLLVYLQCILHFRRKVPRMYWMLALLSLLQVVVAAVISSSYVFGGLLLVYLLVALWALSLFLIHREQCEPKRTASAAVDPLALPDALTTPLAGLIRRLFTGNRRRREPATVTGPPRWPLAEFPCGLASRGSRREREDGAIQGLWRQVLKLGLFTLLLAPLLFVAVPRAQQGQVGWQSTGGSGPSLTGFSENVALDDVTNITESAEDVMRVRFSKFVDGRRGEPYVIEQDVWLRGAVLGLYDRGRWKRSRWYGRLERPIRRRRDPSDGDPVLQEITIEPMRNSRVLFGVAPIYLAPQQPRHEVYIDYHAEQLLRSGGLRNKKMSYEMVTYGFKDGRQLAFRPDRPERPPYNRRSQETYLVRPFLDVVSLPAPKADLAPRNRLSGLKAVADQLVGSQALDPTKDPRRVALALERFLREDGGFAYTLRPPARDPGLDPIEDFVVSNRRGHCEFFASALTLMLRSQGIPARMVVGYKGGEFNPMGEYYQVRQRHAHAWVEAWVSDGGRFGWLRLDPTPAGRAPEETLLTRISQFGNYVDFLWLRYVLGMDPRLQRETVFDPLVAAVQRLIDEPVWSGWYQDLKAVFSGEGPPGAGIALVLVFLLALVLMYGLYRLTRFVLRRLRRDESSTALGRRVTPQVEFYLRLERLLAQCGLHRDAAQTPRELALLASVELAADPRTRGVAPLPARIVEAFYEVRFGRGDLSANEMLIIEETLRRLESALVSAEGYRPNTNRGTPLK